MGLTGLDSMAEPISGYTILSTLYESTNSYVYRAQRGSNNLGVVLKVLKGDYPRPEAMAAYQREYEILSAVDIDGVIRAYDLFEHQNSLVMVLEDFGAESLKKLIYRHPFSFDKAIDIAIQITLALVNIHSANIIHKDINPSNIVMNPATGKLKIIDFGISTSFEPENPVSKNPEILEGTLAYISPEQTGRMNRMIDHRSDFYSLGVTFYQLFTGKLPFESSDALELVYFHLAGQPVLPHVANNCIPEPVSTIIMQLMEKAAEDRYQSAWGIWHDLNECRTQYEKNGEIRSFPLGSQDIAYRFHIPEKLYGREAEKDLLWNTFERVRRGDCELVMVKGYSGIGKTMLVNELYRPITRDNGYFLTGRYDRLHQNIPFTAIIQAFTKLVHQLLTEHEAALESWKHKLTEVLGANSRIMTDMIKELELIIGKQPEIETLQPVESQNRFNLVFQNFIQIFATKDHPLVLFIDDLQWADAASLNLLSFLMSASPRHLFVIGAYRDNEIDPAHPLNRLFQTVESAGKKIEEIALSNLSQRDINRLLTDILQTPPEKTLSLAGAIISKTGGNPFFAKEFVKTLHDEKILIFDTEKRRWMWSYEQIHSLSISENVIDLMAAKIRKLDRHCCHILKLAACIGSRFRQDEVLMISELTIDQITSSLKPTIKEGLILPVSPSTYEFSHERIRQAAYTLIPEDERSSLHFKLANILRENASDDRMDQNIFNIVDQYNLAGSEIQSYEACSMVAGLNLKAGKKARAASAYESAFSYFQTGIEQMGIRGWISDYATCLELHCQAAETAYLCSEFSRMDGYVQDVLHNGKTLLDKIKAYEVKIAGCVAQSRILEAVDTALSVLRLLKIRFPEVPVRAHTVAYYVKTRTALAVRRIEDLVDLPQMTDPYALAAMRILSGMSMPAYSAIPEMYPLFVFKRLLLSLKYGNCYDSVSTYASYGLILTGRLGNIENGYRFGRLALELMGRYNAGELTARTYVVTYCFVMHWKEHVKDTLTILPPAYSAGLETGDFAYAAISGFMYCFNSFLIGRDLSVLERETSAYYTDIQRLRQETPMNYIRILRQALIHLTSGSAVIKGLIGAFYDENKMLPVHMDANDKPALFLVYLCKLILFYLFHEYGKASEYGNMAENHMDGATATVGFSFFHFYNALAQIAAYTVLPKNRKKRVIKKIAAYEKRIQKWARFAPENYQHKLTLIRAERFRILGQNEKAAAHYDLTLNLVKEHGYPNEEALANELTAKFYLSTGNTEKAKAHIQTARYQYLKWGAIAKVRHLDERYYQLLVGKVTRQTSPPLTDVSSTVTATIGRSGNGLDLASAMKASQAISSEIELKGLLKILMQIAVENAGAKKGLLILRRESGYFIEAHAASDPTLRILVEPVPLDDFEDASLAVIRYVIRTNMDVILADAGSEGMFVLDRYVVKTRAKSIMCIPINHHNQLTGLLYLENNEAANVFTSHRLEILKLLTSQAAISIENAKLYTRYRTLYENAVEGIFQTLPEGRFMSVNPTMAKILGYADPEELISTITDIGQEIYYDPEDRLRYAEQLRKHGRSTGFETRFVKKDGTVIWVSISARTVLDSHGKALYFEGSLVDITEQKEKEKAEKEREQANAANRAKSEFLANMSHEIRTPMNAIMGLTDLMLKTDLSDRQQNFLDKIKISSRTLLRIINDILDFSKIEAGKLEIEQVDFQLSNVLENLRNMFENEAAYKGLSLSIEMDRNIPDNLIGDPLRLGQILINLVGNAIKFTEKGRIAVRGNVENIGTRRVTVKFSVADTGIGIPEKEIPKLFTSFVQADGSTTRKFGGTGLGLAISKRLVEMMDGQIWVQSPASIEKPENGHGSNNPKDDSTGPGSIFLFTSTFRFPLQDPARIPQLPAALQGLKVLVVDDDMVSRRTLTEVLKTLNADVTEVDSGHQAIYCMKNSAETGPFQIVLLDWNMPVMNGIETLKKIKKDHGLKETQVIMMTGFAREDAMKSSEAAGADAFLLKPVNRSLLLDTIVQVLDKRERSVNRRTDIPENENQWIEAIRGARVLLAEDNTINQLVAREILESAGMIVSIANNGRQAVDMFQQASFDIVLMDIQMPEMDGFQATMNIRRLKAATGGHSDLSVDNQTWAADVPIIAMTAHAMKGDREKCIEYGMNDYVTKPIDTNELYATLARWISMAKPQKAGNQQNIRPVNDPAVLKKTDAETIDRMDIDSALKRLRGNRNLLIRLLKTFKDDYGNIIEDLRSHMDNGRTENARQLCHLIKGVAGNLGAVALGNAAQQLENELEHGIRSGVYGRLNEFENELTHVIEWIDRQASEEDQTVDNLKTTTSEDGEDTDRPKILTELIRMSKRLSEHNPKAVYQTAFLKKHMRNEQQTAVISQLEAHLERFDFEGARNTLFQLAAISGFDIDDVSEQEEKQ